MRVNVMHTRESRKSVRWGGCVHGDGGAGHVPHVSEGARVHDGAVTDNRDTIREGFDLRQDVAGK